MKLRIQKLKVRRSTLLRLGIAGALCSALACFVKVESDRARLRKNESTVSAVMKHLSSVQAQLQASGACDANGNGAGEYGDFYDLAGGRTPILDRSFARGTRTRVELHGYVFELHLPAEPLQRERYWRAYAWPREYGRTGKQAFMVDQRGDLLWTKNQARRYSGDEVVPGHGAAFKADPGGDLSRSEVGIHGDASDGQRVGRRLMTEELPPCVAPRKWSRSGQRGQTPSQSLPGSS